MLLATLIVVIALFVAYVIYTIPGMVRLKDFGRWVEKNPNLLNKAGMRSDQIDKPESPLEVVIILAEAFERGEKEVVATTRRLEELRGKINGPEAAGKGAEPASA